MPAHFGTPACLGTPAGLATRDTADLAVCVTPQAHTYSARCRARAVRWGGAGCQTCCVADCQVGEAPSKPEGRAFARTCAGLRTHARLRTSAGLAPRTCCERHLHSGLRYRWAMQSGRDARSPTSGQSGSPPKSGSNRAGRYIHIGRWHKAWPRQRCYRTLLTVPFVSTEISAAPTGICPVVSLPPGHRTRTCFGSRAAAITWMAES
jgi:hypothetical protein